MKSTIDIVKKLIMASFPKMLYQHVNLIHYNFLLSIYFNSLNLNQVDLSYYIDNFVRSFAKLGLTFVLISYFLKIPSTITIYNIFFSNMTF